MHELGLVGCCHDDEIGQAGEVGEVVAAGMGGTVLADQTGPVDGEAHRQALQGDIMDHLVVGPLQEGGIDGAERLVALDRQPGGEGDGMLLGDADIEGAVREALLELVETGARRHGGGDGDDPLILLGLADQGIGEHRGVARSVALGLGRLQRHRIEFGDRVIALLVAAP